MIRLAGSIILAVVILFLFAQFIWPAIKREPLFPMFNKRRKRALEELRIQNEIAETRRVEAEVQRRRAARAQAASRRKARRQGRSAE